MTILIILDSGLLLGLDLDLFSVNQNKALTNQSDAFFYVFLFSLVNYWVYILNIFGWRTIIISLPLSLLLSFYLVNSRTLLWTLSVLHRTLFCFCHCHLKWNFDKFYNIYSGISHLRGHLLFFFIIIIPHCLK